MLYELLFLHLIFSFTRCRLFGMYLYLHHRIHSPARPLKILCHVGTREMLLGWVKPGQIDKLVESFSPCIFCSKSCYNLPISYVFFRNTSQSISSFRLPFLPLCTMHFVPLLNIWKKILNYFSSQSHV